MSECMHCHKQPCRYGERKNVSTVVYDSNYKGFFIDLDNNELVVLGVDEGTNKINFCPMCGRELNKFEQDNETNL